MLAWWLSDFKGIQINIARKPNIFVIFQGGGAAPVPPLDPPMCYLTPILVAADLPLIFVQPLNCFKNYAIFDCNDPENNYINNRHTCLTAPENMSKELAYFKYCCKCR